MLAAVSTLAYNFHVLTPLFAVVGSLWLARRSALGTRFLAVAYVALGATSGAFALAPSLLVASLVAATVGATSILVLSGTNGVLQLQARPEMRGRVLALFGVILLGTTPIGAPVAGWAAERFGVRAALALGAVCALATGAAVLLGGRRTAAAAPAVLGPDQVTPDERALEAA